MPRAVKKSWACSWRRPFSDLSSRQSRQRHRVFGSGIGGLTVLHKIIEALPRENTVYLGDTARAPYGTEVH